MTSTNALPDVITRYLAAADAKDIDTLADCFTPNGTVVDEGNTHVGRAAIRAWREQTIAQSTYTTAVTAPAALETDKYLVTTRVEGNFPGGVVDLRFTFAVAGGFISSLHIGE